MSFLSKLLVKSVLPFSQKTLSKSYHVCATLLNSDVEVPPEEPPPLGTPYSEILIGVVNEKNETRIAQSPKSVAELTKLGFKVVVEKGCGNQSNFSDAEYEESGAKIINTAEEILKTCDILLKLNSPDVSEIEKLKPSATVISFLYPAQNEEITKKLLAKKVTSFAMDCVPRISRAQVFDALSSMSNISGYKSVIDAANHFKNFFAGQMTAAGRVDPAKVLVIGGGVAGLAAIQTAKNMGAVVRCFDTRPDCKEQVESMGGTFLTVDFEEEDTGDGVYAKEMSPEFIEAEMALFAKQAEEVDIIITTALIPGKRAPLLIKREHIEAMKQGSVVVDLAAISGGNIETTKPGEIYTYKGVTHIGKYDYPSQLPEVSSTLYSNNIRKLLESMGDKKKGFFHIDLEDEVVRGSIVTRDGEMLWPAPVKPVVEVVVEEKVVVEEEVKKELTTFQKTMLNSILYTGTFAGIQSIGLVKESDLVNMFSIFSLGCIVGYKVVTNVLPALHSPLISVTNAVSGIIVAGGLCIMPEATTAMSQLLGAAAVFISSVNVFGGFLITQKMLNMFRKADDPPEYVYLYGIPALATGIAYLACRAKGYPMIHEGTNLLASIACILALGGLCQQNTARMGNALGMTGVGLGILATLGSLPLDGQMMAKMAALGSLGGAIGLYVANRVKLTDLPQLVALFHSFVGLAACLVSFGSFLSHPHVDLLHDLSISLGAYIGGITFTGSIIAFAKLQGILPSTPWALPGKNVVNGLSNGLCLGLSAYFCMNQSVGTGVALLSAITGLSFFAGAHITTGIGGADMPVVITVLNSASGWALCAEGFLLNNKLLTIVGALVGASGAILSNIMCVAMNRSIGNVLFKGVKAGSGLAIEGTYQETNIEQLSDWMVNANKVVIVPGFGLAVSKAQYAIADMVNKLTARGCEVKFAIHPVAGRMPGQMNVLLAEAGVPHDIVFEMEEVEDGMEEVDVVLCIGSNDIYNSSANDDPDSPIAGMPVINVWDAEKTIVFKRSAPGIGGLGYSAIDNPVFYMETTSMLLGDAKESCDALLTAVVEKL